MQFHSLMALTRKAGHLSGSETLTREMNDWERHFSLGKRIWSLEVGRLVETWQVDHYSSFKVKECMSSFS